MSVYTSISARELEGFLAEYDRGRLVEFEGILSGIENTNYFVTTSQGEYVLTIFEQHDADELVFFLDLTAYLSEHHTPCAHPVMNKAGRYLGRLKGKPAALVERLRGAAVERPTAGHCAALGGVLAKLHLDGLGFTQARPNDRGPHWWNTTAKALFGRLDAEDAGLLRDELAFQYRQRERLAQLPRGIIHADLFRDNVLFDGDKLSGLIDFYYACTDVLVYDIAVTVNDWCSTGDGALDAQLVSSFSAGYQRLRALQPDEHSAWPAMLRAGALRFWLSRLHDLHFPRPGEMTHTKDPDTFKRILLKRREVAIPELRPS